MTGISFQILAVKSLCRQEQEDWWAAILTDRKAPMAFHALSDEQMTFEFWAEMAAWPDHDVNVVYGPDGEKAAFFWLCNRAGYGAYFNFGFLAAGLPWKMEIGRYVLKVLSKAGYRCLASLTPYFNLHVVAYGQAMGGTVAGRWPGICYVAARKEWVDGILLQFILKGD